MTVFVLGRGFPNKKYPLNGIFEWDQAKMLKESGYKVVFLAVDLRSIRRCRKLGFVKYFESDIPVYSFSFPLGRTIPIIIGFLTEVLYKFLYKKAVKNEGKPDLIHAHFALFQGYGAVKLKESYGIPVVITEHSSELLHDIKKNKMKYYRMIYLSANKIIAVSNYLALKINKIFDVECDVIYNVVDLHLFTFKQRIIKNNFVFICTANLTKGKGIDILIKAVDCLKNENIHLYIIGDGIERESLEKMVRERSLENKITFLGRLNRVEISKYLTIANIFVLPSRFETFGVSYIEAMATGIPVIATKCGGPEEFVNKSNGILVDVDDVDGLACAMRNMMQSFNDYDLKEISNEIVDRFSSNKIALEVKQVYKNITGLAFYE